MKSKFYLSAALGAFFGLIGTAVLFFLDRSFIWMGPCAGVSFGFGLFIILVVNDKIEQKKYRKAEKDFSKEIRLSKNANFLLCGQVKNGNLYLFDDEILILCLDGKPYWKISIPYSGIRSIKAAKAWELAIKTEHFEIMVTAVDAEALLERIKMYSMIE